MRRYRHATHAGNHADVLKHAILLQLLHHLSLKDKPYWMIDTHAGAGLYALEDAWSRQGGEIGTGLGRLLDAPNPPALVVRYLDAIGRFNPDGTIRQYPGSPCLAVALSRPGDQLHLFEHHPPELARLRTQMNQWATGRRRSDAQANATSITVYGADGFDSLRRLLPPPPRRAVVLLDPSYADHRDYGRVLKSLREGLDRFAQGCYAIWHPLVQRREAHDLMRALQRIPLPWLHATLTIRQPLVGARGLHGSGMFIINPPWTLAAELRAALSWLCSRLALDGQARWDLAEGPRRAGAARPRAKARRSPIPRSGSG